MSVRKRIKTWSYKQITEAIEYSIRVEMELAEQTADVRMKHIHQCRGAGALAAWRALTMGWQVQGDSRRLEALVLSPESIAALERIHGEAIPVEFSAECHVCQQHLDTRTAVPLEQRGQGRLYRHIGCQLK